MKELTIETQRVVDELRAAKGAIESTLGHGPMTAVMGRAISRISRLDVRIKAVLESNGGPIDAGDTTDGVHYVMVRRDQFDLLENLTREGP